MTYSRKKDPAFLLYCIDDIHLQRVTQRRDLGTTFDNLSFFTHIDSIVTNAFKTVELCDQKYKFI